MVSPHDVVGSVNDSVAIAIGVRRTHSGKRVLPSSVVRPIDALIAIVITDRAATARGKFESDDCIAA